MNREELLQRYATGERDFRGINLSKADLSGANLSKADFSGANLSRVQALETNFEDAILTGACIEDWNINSATNLNNIICDYIYLKNNQQERRPLNPNKNFSSGEFTKLFQNALETVDLIFSEGIDWKAFQSAFGKLQVESDDNELLIQAIEKKYDGTFVIRVKVSPEFNNATIEQVVQENYRQALEALEAKYRAELKAKEEQISLYREQNESMKELVLSMANRPLTIEIDSISNDRKD